MDYENKTITVQTVKPIKAGEELTINYSAGWDDWQPVWFDEA
jgi:SET domain-containing protein